MRHALKDALNVVTILLLAGWLLYVLVAQPSPSEPVVAAPAITVIVVTATAPAVTMSPVQPSKTPQPPIVLDQLPARTMLPSATPTSPPEPTVTPLLPANRPAVQKG